MILEEIVPGANDLAANPTLNEIPTEMQISTVHKLLVYLCIVSASRAVVKA